MGFNFKYRTLTRDKKKGYKTIPKGSILIYPDIDSFKLLVLFSMYVRFIWEGYFRRSLANGDNFYIVLIHYLKLREIFKKTSKHALLGMACDIFSQLGYRYNSNHFPCLGSGMRIYKNVPVDKLSGFTQVNSIFTRADETYIEEYKNISDLCKKSADRLGNTSPFEEEIYRQIHDSLIKHMINE